MGSLNTIEFKKLLQENFRSCLKWEGRYDLSRELAWELYKTGFVSALQYLMRKVDPKNPEDVKLILKGLGVWKIVFRRPKLLSRQKATVVGKLAKVPFLRYTSSVRFRRLLLKKFFGVTQPIPVSAATKAKRAADRKRQRDAKAQQKSPPPDPNTKI